MRMLLPIIMACGLSAAAALAQQPLPPQDFAARAAVTHMFGLESATLALHKTSSPEIKSFAHKLANEHGTTASTLRQVAARRSDIALPERPDSRHLDLLRDLAGKQGPDFDRAYVQAQQEAHGEAAALLAAYAENGTDPELKAFAAKALPTLQELDRQAKALPAR